MTVPCTSQDLRDLRVGLLFRGEFRRLAPHMGAIVAYRDLCQVLGLAAPALIVGGSAGLIAGEICASSIAPPDKKDNDPWSDSHLATARDIILNLERGHIFEIPMRKKAAAISAGISALFPLLTLVEPDMSRKKRMALHLVEEAVSVVTIGWAVREFLNTEGIFSPEPLRKTLQAIDYERVFKSRTELRAMVTDVETEEHVAFSSHDPRNQNRERFVEITLASAALPPWFPLVRLDGRALSDAEVKRTLPFEQFTDCDVILVFNYLPFTERRNPPKMWPENLSVTWAISRGENVEVTLKQYNQECLRDPRLPEPFFIQTEEKVNDLTIQSFNQKALRQSFDIGYRAVMNSAESICHMFGRAIERKKFTREIE